MSAPMTSKAPSLLWTLTEGRSLLELNAFYLMRRALRTLPHGDGHPVIVLPGFMASDSSTRPLRGLLNDLEYSAYGWDLGRNLRFDDRREDQMLALLDTVHTREARKVSIIGWSLGGVFAREIAKKNPDAVRSVITLGSPITGDLDCTNATRLYEYFNGAPSQTMQQRLATLGTAPPVPTTSIYSKSDGVVAWRGSIQDPALAPAGQSENIRVPASHCGLGVNPMVMSVVADRLAQTEGRWSPFQPKGMTRFTVRH